MNGLLEPLTAYLCSTFPSVMLDMDTTAPEPTSKRKRSGKAREEAKARAIAAAEAAKLQQQQEEEEMDVDEEMRGDGGGSEEMGDAKDDVKTDEEPAEWKPELEVLRKRIVSTVYIRCLYHSLIPHFCHQPQGIKSLHPILKRAKISETQRIIKKIKFLRTKTDGDHAAELAELAEQLDALKV